MTAIEVAVLINTEQFEARLAAENFAIGGVG